MCHISKKYVRAICFLFTHIFHACFFPLSSFCPPLFKKLPPHIHTQKKPESPQSPPEKRGSADGGHIEKHNSNLICNLGRPEKKTPFFLLPSFRPALFLDVFSPGLPFSFCFKMRCLGPITMTFYSPKAARKSGKTWMNSGFPFRKAIFGEFILWQPNQILNNLSNKANI